MEVYFDYGATSIRKPLETFKALSDFYMMNNSNAGRGAYDLALDAGKMIYETRERLIRFLGNDRRRQVVFTKNITEAINVVIKGLAQEGDHFLISSIEHNSVYRVMEHLRNTGKITYDIIPVSKEGKFPLAMLSELTKDNTKGIILNHISNVSGHIMPAKEVGEYCKEKDLSFIIDGAQSAGVIPVDLNDYSEKTIFCFTGHKHLMGPQGIGGFLITEEVGQTLDTLIDGGTGSFSEEGDMPLHLPDRFEAGTQNGLGIAGLNGAVSFLETQDLRDILKKEKILHDALYEGLKDISGISFYGDMKGEKTGIISLNIEGMDNSELAFILSDEYGILARSGLHCSPLAHETFHNLEGSLRFSLGYYSTVEEVEYVVSVMKKVCSQ